MRVFSLVWFPISKSQRVWGLGTRLTILNFASKVMATGVNKDHLERLHSRVDQQSTLIEMLKQRADKTQHEVRTTCS
jgi:hypothetical protein